MARTFQTKLAGTSHKNNDGTDRQKIIRDHAVAGQPLILISEPENEFDKFAIGAWINCKGALHQIGYLDSRLAGEVTRLMARGGGAAATIQAIIGGTTELPTSGVRFEMTKFEPGEKIVQPELTTLAPSVVQPPRPFIIDPPAPALYSVAYVIGRFIRRLFP